MLYHLKNECLYKNPENASADWRVKHHSAIKWYKAKHADKQLIKSDLNSTTEQARAILENSIFKAYAVFKTEPKSKSKSE